MSIDSKTSIDDILYSLGIENGIDSFYTWAFGEDAFDFNHGMQFMDAWNRRHWHEYSVQPEGNVVDDLQIMWELWDKWHEKERGEW